MIIVLLLQKYYYWVIIYKKIQKIIIIIYYNIKLVVFWLPISMKYILIIKIIIEICFKII